MSAAPHSRSQRDVILVGAGHAHIQVLRAFAMDRPPEVRLTLVVDTPVAVYSGMVPGVVAGQYRPEEVEIDAVPLARRAGARVVLARATGVDVGAKRIRLAGRPSLPYDLASVDIGSTVTGHDLPGVREHALATRPIGRFLAGLAAVEAQARAACGPLRVVVVGGGAAGCELVCTLQTRLAACMSSPDRLEMSLLHAGQRPLPGYPDAVVARVERVLEARGIRRLAARTVTGAGADGVRVGGGDVVPADVLIWATGAAAHPFFADSGLPTDERGFVLTRPTLQAVGDEALFAVGDCATLADFQATPKAGVYAVRQGPVLVHNLRAALGGAPLARYRPQRDFLTLLNLGDGTALGAKWGRAFDGRWVMRWKDRIDRRFMRRFQVLAADGSTAPPVMADGEGGMEMVCGGCAAKLGQESLERALDRLPAPPPAPEVELGLAEADDVVAWRLPAGDLLVASVDSFRAFTDDPWLVGRVAALNAVSDLEAKGVAARWAQAIVALPLADDERAAEETLFQVLAGARSVFDPLGVRLLGGHTSRAVELQVGFAVQGVATDGGVGLLRRRGRELAAGQRLVLTKALGTGVVWHADMAGRARGRWIEAALASMQVSNAAAAAIGRRHGATAATDITGFGLAGHLASMLAGSGLSARLALAALPALPGALSLLAAGERSTFHDENARLRRAMAIPTVLAADPRLELLFDPQTAGGLLLVVPAAASAGVLDELQAACAGAAVDVGEVAVTREDGAVIEVAGEIPAAGRRPGG
jgi:selenide,water dikinase